ncbi:MAG: hypothetical protein KatS3mg110_4307 [Pirellulaceae bacterium]|nr:MAG: hypothetical protein KatS3mg110_4307 [Pirellulaceae bacterium]
MVKGVVVSLVLVGAAPRFLPAEPKEEDAAVERTRRTVRMLDDVYKAAVVLITDKYVHDEDDFPAGSAAIALFDAVRKKGWHDVRLLDVTGEPYDAKNRPRDEFEKKAAEQLRKGRDYVESIESTPDGRFLRAATAIPVVMPKCTMCHPHYKDVPAGRAVGMLSYRLRIE